jgi:DNA-binding transcriptional MerR regulator/effector-binding domain-containing protein
MFNIGDFARLGGVSVRMLRHYDAIGLLRPAHVDPDSGYRSYDAPQLQRLNRVIALKELGFKLQQVQSILDDEVSVEELHGMLRLRRAQLEAQMAADASRLGRVEARLRAIESEGHMNTQDVVLKGVTPVRLAELTDVAASYEADAIGPVIRPLYEELGRRLEAAGITPVGPPVAYYEPSGESNEAVTVHAGLPVDENGAAGHDFAIVDLPPIESAATLLHRGAMDDVDGSYQTLAHWIEEHGYRTDGFHREVYLECPAAREDWVTELQVAVAPERS